MLTGRRFGATPAMLRPPMANVALVGRDESGDHPQQRGLAAARRSQDREEAAPRHAEGQRVARRRAAKRLTDARRASRSGAGAIWADAAAQLAALTRSRIRPSISSRPGGMAGYQMAFFRPSREALGELRLELEGPSVASAPWEAVKLPMRLGDLGGDVRPHGEVDPRVHAGIVAPSRRKREGIEPADRPGFRIDELDVGIFAVQLPADRCPTIIAATTSPVRMPLSSWSLLSKKNRRFGLQAVRVLPDLLHQRRVGLGIAVQRRKDSCPGRRQRPSVSAASGAWWSCLCIRACTGPGSR